MLQAIPDPKKKRSIIKKMLDDLQEAWKSIADAHIVLQKPSVGEQDILMAFRELTRAEDCLWRLRDQMDVEEVDYLTARQLDDLLSDMNTTYSIPRIQLYLRILVQSKQQLASSEAQERIILAHNGLRQLQRELSSLSRNLEAGYVKLKLDR